jgi:hypothetical protein
MCSHNFCNSDLSPNELIDSATESILVDNAAFQQATTSMPEPHMPIEGVLNKGIISARVVGVRTNSGLFASLYFVPFLATAFASLSPRSAACSLSTSHGLAREGTVSIAIPGFTNLGLNTPMIRSMFSSAVT